jgi:hypothetical protein
VNSLSLPAAAAACSPAVASGGLPLTPSNETPSVSESFALDRQTACCPFSVSTPTSQPSAAGPASMTSCLEGSLASLSVLLPEGEKPRQICGQRCSESCLNAAPNGSSRKTSDTPRSDLPRTTCLHTVIVVPICAYKQPIWVPPTNEGDCGLLPTPTRTCNHTARSMQKHASCRRLVRLCGGRLTPALWEFLMGWPEGWTDPDAKCSETGKSPWSRRLPGES